MLEFRIEWKLGPNGLCFEYEGFGDGSGLHSSIDTSLRRCGWCVVDVATGQDDIIRRFAEAWGPLPGILQNVPMAEAFTFRI